MYSLIDLLTIVIVRDVCTNFFVPPFFFIPVFRSFNILFCFVVVFGQRSMCLPYSYIYIDICIKALFYVWFIFLLCFGCVFVCLLYKDIVCYFGYWNNACFGMGSVVLRFRFCRCTIAFYQTHLLFLSNSGNKFYIASLIACFMIYVVILLLCFSFSCGLLYCWLS